MTEKKCQICGKKFKRGNKEIKIQWEKRKFCSLKCFHNSLEKKIKIICEICKIPFKVQFHRYKAKYCSITCRNIGLKLRTDLPQKLPKTSIIKNCVICSKPFRVLQSEIRRNHGIFCSKICHGIYDRNENHRNWKGSKVSYSGLHHWVKRYLGRPTKCEHCNKEGLIGKQIHWANKDHQYERNLSDWIRLCAMCHKIYDEQFNLR